MVFKILFLFIPFLLFSEMGYREPWGEDSDLVTRSTKAKKIHTSSNFATQTAHAVIHFHQNFLSPTTGPRSSFRPSSSRYMELAIKRYGFLKGFVMGCDRLLRENDEKWVYRIVTIDGKDYKYDPAFSYKYYLER